jgi:hypothetical protein
VVLAVAHREFTSKSVEEYAAKLAPGGLLMDVKCQTDAADFQKRGIQVWRL